ncbi:hypothetical protein [Demequina subtropica]|uniref:hypothetical protein n=1 Tax=Demequina subtropica TaxID=1638989 RepID=UPI000784F929|nr:hypothetical protein [Demequina subtropica]
MIVRTLATAALGTALALGPALAASAELYPAPEGALTCSATQVPVDTVFTCTVTSDTGTYAQLQTVFAGDDATIAGTVTSSEVALVDGASDFTVTAPSIVGTIGITGIVDGTAVDTASVEVVASDVAGGGGTTGSAGGGLSGTGFENQGLAIGAGVLLVAGAATVYIAARRRSAGSH